MNIEPPQYSNNNIQSNNISYYNNEITPNTPPPDYSINTTSIVAYPSVLLDLDSEKKKCIFRVLFMCLSLVCVGQRLFVGEEKKTSVALTSRSRFVRIIAKIASQKSHSLYVLTSWWTTKTTLRAKRDNRNTKRTLTHRACASA